MSWHLNNIRGQNLHVKNGWKCVYNKHLRATEHHLPNVITKCYQPPDTNECVPPGSQTQLDINIKRDINYVKVYFFIVRKITYTDQQYIPKVNGWLVRSSTQEQNEYQLMPTTNISHGLITVSCSATMSKTLKKKKHCRPHVHFCPHEAWPLLPPQCEHPLWMTPECIMTRDQAESSRLGGVLTLNVFADNTGAIWGRVSNNFAGR